MTEVTTQDAVNEEYLRDYLEMLRLVEVDEIAKLIDKINQLKGWNEERSEGEWAALAHSEISEAFESWRDGESPIWFTDNGKPEGAAIEYADTIIRIFHWFARHHLSIADALQMKLLYNIGRPYRHGGKQA